MYLVRNYRISMERPEDYFTVENLTREAFWNVYRPGCVEHYILHKFRQNPDFIPQLSLCLWEDNKIIAHIMYVHSQITTDEGKIIPIMTFGPISVDPHYQHQGFGSAILKYSMEKAQKMGATILAITGDINFYGRFGFVKGITKNIRYYAALPTTDVSYFLVKELVLGSLTRISGVFKDSEGYDFVEKDVQLFDQNFSTKK